MTTDLSQPLLEPLTDREREILALIADGLSNREIAQTLVLSVGTVKWYAKQLYSKLGVSSRTQAAARGRELGLLGGEAAGEPTPAASTSLSVPHNLPAQVTTFVGREQEIADVLERLVRHRLVTLVGPGGVGKTRLALQVAGRLVERFADGVLFVDLAPLADPDRLSETIAATLDLQEVPGRSIPDTLSAYLRERQLLLLLDNFEHLTDAAPQVADLLAAAPGLRILVTSRAVLHLYGEHVYEVPPLSLPVLDEQAARAAPASEAVKLFIQRATATGAELALTEETLRDIAAICIRLDGLPLAIELAAARTRLFSPEMLLRKLSASFDALRGGPRDHHERHQTLRATIDWSYDLLGEEEQRLFARLAVFKGGRTIEAVEEVCAADLRLDVVDGLESLLDKSLLRQVDGPEHEPHFRMLETIHEYACEKLDELGETELMRQRHARYFLALVERGEPQLITGRHQLHWLRRLEAGYGNLQLALDWAFGGGDVDIGLRLFGALHWFWYRQGHYGEWQVRAEQAAQRIDGQPPPVQAKALLAIGGLGYAQQEPWRGREPLERALALFRELDDPFYTAFALLWLAILSIGKPEEYEQAVAQAEEAVSIHRALGEQAAVAQGLNVIGELARTTGHYARAKAAYAESFAIAEAIGDKLRQLMMHENLGYIAMREGDYEQAFDLFRSGLTLSLDVRIPFWYFATLGALAGAVTALGEPEQAATLLSASQKLNQRLGSMLQPADQMEFDAYEAAIRSQLDEESLARAWEAGQAMSFEEALDYALALNPRAPGA